MSDELSKIHSVPIHHNINLLEDFIIRFNKKIGKLKKLNISIDYDLLSNFVLSNLSALNKTKATIIHGDFCPMNIVVNKDIVTFIDMDVCTIDHPWKDLCTVVSNMKYKDFYKELFNNYFCNDIPDDFWIVYNLYGILEVLDFIIYCSRTPKIGIDVGISKFEEFIKNNNGFTIMKPKWFENDKYEREKI